MSKRTVEIECRRVELDGIRYVIVRESVFEHLCRRAGLEQLRPEDESTLAAGLALDRVSLAEKVIRRRKAVGLSQAELARRAGVRPETLNRIERGRTTPDFATIRKLVEALTSAERRQLAENPPHTYRKRPSRPSKERNDDR